MTGARLLTRGEVSVLGHAAERWLRLRDVELNLGELALAVLRNATLRPAECQRQDIASINWTVEAELLDASEALAITLVTPSKADIALGRVSILSAVGLALIGHAMGTVVRVPLPSGQTIDAQLVATRPCADLVSCTLEMGDLNAA